MNTKDLRKLTVEELQKKIESLEKEIADIYFDMRTGKQKDVRKPRAMRKELAQLLTVVREKELLEDNMSETNNG